MKSVDDILKEITDITTEIETNYPELYRNLDENPITLKENHSSHLNKKALQDYLERLKQLLKHHT
ncbi:MAG: hypothetical protein ABJD66_12090 [Cellulophaga sp.]|uniref:hypothetical protein n=1 Tax=unclassified Cellulophaga TaxID=2634405 RepID=UPI000C2BA13C|nr:hypothetical protein [Cellulophaga sp. RHA19]PKB44191.1 hypothetical protein AX016_2405 [Cellulophaga sp. RHA19]